MDYPNIDPIAVSIGPLVIHWYGVMYLVAFAAGGLLGLWRAKHAQGAWSSSLVWDLVFYVAVGAVVGGVHAVVRVSRLVVRARGRVRRRRQEEAKEARADRS